jgi:hypothetical protein
LNQVLFSSWSFWALLAEGFSEKVFGVFPPVANPSLLAIHAHCIIFASSEHSNIVAFEI